MAAEDRGDLDKAESLLKSLHTRHQGIFALDESLGLLFVRRQKFEEALPFLKSAALEQSNSDAAHANLGAAYYQLHRNKEALAEFQVAARLNPANVAAEQGLGRLLMEGHQPARAADAFAAAFKLSPDNFDLILDRAQALNAAGQQAQAVTELRSMPGGDQSSLAQSLLGDAEEKLGSYQAAAQYYTRAVELDPSEDNVWALGVEFLRHWTFDAAIREFEAAARKFPASTRIKLGLGAAYFGGAKYPESIPVFADLLKNAPDNSLYAEMLGMACTTVAESSKLTCAALVNYAESHPQDAKASTYAASMLMTESQDDNRISQAQRLLQNATAADSRFAEARYQLGILRQNQGDWAGSIAHLEKALSLKPDLSQAHYRLALAYWRSGRKQEAQAQMNMQKEYSSQQQADLDTRLRQITTFIVEDRH